MAYIWRLSVFSTGKQTYSDGEGTGERSPGKKAEVKLFDEFEKVEKSTERDFTKL